VRVVLPVAGLAAVLVESEARHDPGSKIVMDGYNQ